MLTGVVLIRSKRNTNPARIVPNQSFLLFNTTKKSEGLIFYKFFAFRAIQTPRVSATRGTPILSAPVAQPGGRPPVKKCSFYC
jgi:hypothetical protein